MNERPEDVCEVQVTLLFTRKEVRALEALGHQLALEGEPIGLPASEHTAIELAVHFIVGANLWAAREALDLPGEDLV